MPKLNQVLQGSNQILDAIRPMVQGPRNPLENVRGGMNQGGMNQGGMNQRLPVQSSPENSPLNSPRQNQRAFDFTQSMNPQNQMMNPPIQSPFQNQGGANPFGDKMEQFRQAFGARRPENF